MLLLVVIQDDNLANNGGTFIKVAVPRLKHTNSVRIML